MEDKMRKLIFVVAITLMIYMMTGNMGIVCAETPDSLSNKGYLFKSKSIKEIEKTFLYKKIKNNFGSDFEDYMTKRVEIVDPMAHISLKKYPYKFLSPKLKDLSKDIFVSPTSESSYISLYSFVVLTKARLPKSVSPPCDKLGFNMDWVEMNLLLAVISDAAEKLPDGNLKRVSVDAFLDIGDVMKMLETSVTFQNVGCEAFNSKLLSIYLESTFKSYSAIKESTKDSYIITAINKAEDALRKTDALSSNQISSKLSTKSTPTNDKNQKGNILPLFKSPLKGSN
jgi:hypothetical protein